MKWKMQKLQIGTHLQKIKKELFYKDATHPNGQGSKEYTNLLKTELSKYLKKEH